MIFVLKHLRSFSSVAKTVKSINTPKTARRFDSYTWSIWAENLAKRGKIDEALNMLENRIDEKRMPKEQLTVLFNTAIDICGHSGKFNKAWKIFNDMKKRCIAPNERTVVSMVNALAEGVKQKISSDQFDSNSIWEQGCRIIGEIDSSYKLNALLKLCLRLGDVGKIKTIFSLTRLSPLANEITYTTALNILGRHGSFEDCQILMLSMIEGGNELCKLDYVPMMLSIKTALRTYNGHWTNSFRTVQSLNVSSVLEMFSKQFAEPPPRQLLSLALESSLMLRNNELSLSLIEKYIMPNIKNSKRLNEIKSICDDYLVSLALRVYSRSSSAKATFAFYEELVKRELKPTVNDINALLFSCSIEKLGNRAESVFSANFRKKRANLKPTKHTLIYIVRCFPYMLENSRKTILDWFKISEEELYLEAEETGLIKNLTLL